MAEPPRPCELISVVSGKPLDMVNQNCFHRLLVRLQLRAGSQPGNPSNHHRSTLRQQLPQNRTMASLLILAITPHRKTRPMRKRRQHIQFPAPVRRVHLPPELLYKPRPCLSVRSFQSLRHQLRIGRKIRKPNIVIIQPRKVGLKNTTRGTPYCAQPQTFTRQSRRAEPYDIDRHMRITSTPGSARE